MPRPKSVFRQNFTYRRLRWRLWRALPSHIGPLARWLNFYRWGAFPSEIADKALEATTRTVVTGFTEDEKAFVRDLCRADADSTPADASGTADFVLRTHLVHDAEVLGHTGAVVVPALRTAIWPAVGPPDWNMAKPRPLRRLGPLERRAVSLSGTDNYFHFMMNDLLPLIDYLERLHPAGMPLSVTVPRPPHRFATEALQAVAAAYRDVDIVRVGPRERLALREVVTLERRTGNREWFVWDADVVRRLKTILFEHLQPAPAAGARRIFVQRGAARIRHLVNEPEIFRLLEARGFEPFKPRAGNLAEQLSRFDAAHLVVSVHGAALTNLMWCRPGTEVLELFPSNFVKSTYLYLADRMGLRYTALTGSPGNRDLAFSVDSGTLARTLDGIAERAA